MDEASAKRLYDDNVDGCDVEIIETKIGLDWLAFALIIFQLRVLHSYLFQYVIIDIRCEIIQASRLLKCYHIQLIFENLGEQS